MGQPARMVASEQQTFRQRADLVQGRDMYSADLASRILGVAVTVGADERPRRPAVHYVSGPGLLAGFGPSEEAAWRAFFVANGVTYEYQVLCVMVS